VKLDGSVLIGQDLPVATYGHCMVKMHDGRVAILGGTHPQVKKVYFFDPSKNTYNSFVPSMNNNRIYSACTLIYSQKHGNRPVILVAGGLSENTAEVLDYTASNTWEQIGNLPGKSFEFSGANAIASVTGNGAILNRGKKFYTLSCTTTACTWEKMEQELATFVSDSVMMHLPPGLTPWLPC